MSLHNPHLQACLDAILNAPEPRSITQSLPRVHCPRCNRALLVYGRPGKYWAAHPLCGGACQDDLKTWPRAEAQEGALTNAIDDIFQLWKMSKTTT